MNDEKVSGAGVPARQASAQAGKPVPPEELFRKQMKIFTFKFLVAPASRLGLV